VPAAAISLSVGRGGFGRAGSANHANRLQGQDRAPRGRRWRRPISSRAYL